jgi:hypothetical protein
MLNPFRRKVVHQKLGVAVIDASTIYGAGRWCFGDHDDPNWAYAKQFRADEDKLLFNDFLHDILLNDQILLDDTSLAAQELRTELRRMIDLVNQIAGYPLIKEQPIAPKFQLKPLIDVVCQLVKRASEEPGQEKLEDFVAVPWYYKTHLHHDQRFFSEAATRWGLNPNLLPFSMYVYRGLCYAGYANHNWKKKRVPTVYLASPGRLRALQPILSRDAMRKLEYPHSSYAELVNMLDLPDNGYDFSHLDLNVAQVSALTSVLEPQDPREALDLVMKLRGSNKGVSMRKAWADKVWASSNSCAVGAISSSNMIAGSTVYGDVSMVLHASA